jgi:hypothetical protein
VMIDVRLEDWMKLLVTTEQHARKTA